MQKTPPGMNRRRLVEAAAATVSTLGLPSLVLAEESSSMSAVAQPKGGEKTAIHPFHVNVPEAQADRIAQTHKRVRWPKRETVTDESQGVLIATIQELARYWAADYNWRRAKARLKAVHDRDRWRGHRLHSRSLETRSRVAADCR